jgi:hypothetical protein
MIRFLLVFEVEYYALVELKEGLKELICGL